MRTIACDDSIQGSASRSGRLPGPARAVALFCLVGVSGSALADVTLYSQPVEPSSQNIGFSFFSSPIARARRSFKHADDFVLSAPSEVRAVRWWGINEGVFSNGLANYDQFTIEFFTSQPSPGGQLVATLLHSENFTIAQTAPTNTGRINPLNNQAEMVHFATLASPFNLPANTQLWIAVSAHAINGAGDAWGWRDGTLINGYSNTYSFTSGAWTGFQDTDSAFELIGVPAPTSVATLALAGLLTGRRRR